MSASRPSQACYRASNCTQRCRSPKGTQVPETRPPPTSHSPSAATRLWCVTMTPRPRGRSAYVCLSVVLIVSAWCLGDPSSRVNASGSWVIKPPPGTAVDTTSPLANGLVAAWHFDQGATPVNLANPALSGVYMGAPLLSPT